jgi:catechol 2,3-dioxygenase-like lactoylglutathione lyase family enzyme
VHVTVRGARIPYGLSMLRFDHVGVVVDDLELVAGFFASLGFERDGGMVVEGEVVDRINGLDGVRSQVTMLSVPDGTGKLELVKYLSPPAGERPPPFPANEFGLRHLCFEIADVAGTVARLRQEGFEPVGEVQDYGDSWRLVYVRGPEGLIVELAERISG